MKKAIKITVDVLMSLHLGLHWGSTVGFVTRKTNSAPDAVKNAVK